MTDNKTRALWREATIRQLIRREDQVGGTVLMSRRYLAAVEDVWDAWTSPERTARWLGTVSGDLSAGGEVLLVMSEDERVACRITVCEPPRRLAVIWREAGEPESAAEIRLRPDGDGTILELEHGRLLGDRAVGYGYGWEDFLDRLSALLAGGDPAEISWAHNREILKPLWDAASAI